MALNNRHPYFLDSEPDYRMMFDAFSGERHIKNATTKYLPPTRAMTLDGFSETKPRTEGSRAYRDYLLRAHFPSHLEDAVRLLTGVMDAKPAVIELPPELEPLRARATRKGESLDVFLRWMHEQQLLYGRLGMFVDFPIEADPQQPTVPHIVAYSALQVINWDDQRPTEYSTDQINFVVIDETAFVRNFGFEPQTQQDNAHADPFEWFPEHRYRALLIAPRGDGPLDAAPVGPLVYQSFTEANGERSESIVPMFRGKALDFVPFVFVGANDLDPKPDLIPLGGLARLCLHIYRQDADYREALHHQGQDTLVVQGTETNREGEQRGDEEPTRVGAGAVIRLSAEAGTKAYYIGIDSKGIPEQRAALAADNAKAESLGVKLLEQHGAAAESGDALRIRVAASTANLKLIAMTAAAGLEQILKYAAMWIGADPALVKVTPNLDFTQQSPAPELLRQFSQSRKDGAPISLESMHQWMTEHGFSKVPFDEEMRRIANEQGITLGDAKIAQEQIDLAKQQFEQQAKQAAQRQPQPPPQKTPQQPPVPPKA